MNPDWIKERCWAFWCIKNAPLRDGNPYAIRWNNWGKLPELVDAMEAGWLAGVRHEKQLVEDAVEEINKYLTPGAVTVAECLTSAFGIDVYYLPPRAFIGRMATSATAYKGRGATSEERNDEFSRFFDVLYAKAKEMQVVV